MTRFTKELRAACLVALVIGLAGTSARADIILEQYEFQGQSGTETTLAPSFTTSGLSAMIFGQSGVTPGAGTNSMSSSGWTNPLASYSFGFTIQAGQSVTVDQLILTSRSSGTGPGFVNLEVSVDGGALKTLASITQTSTNYNDEFLSITPVTATKSLTFYFVAANQTSAAGATVGSTGTFRVGDYNPAGTATPFTINGTITSASVTVPEPSTLTLVGLGLSAVGLLGKARRRIS